MVDGYPEYVLDMFGFALDLVVDEDISVDDFDGFAGSSDQSFDEILFRFGRIFKHDDVPGLGFGEEIEIFQDQDTVAVADARFMIRVKSSATEGANREIALRTRRLGAIG